MGKDVKEKVGWVVKGEESVRVVYLWWKGEFGSVLGGGEVSGGCEVREVKKVMEGLVEGWGCSGFVEGLKVGMDSGGGVKKGG